MFIPDSIINARELSSRIDCQESLAARYFAQAEREKSANLAEAHVRSTAMALQALDKANELRQIAVPTLSEYCYLIGILTPDERKTLLEIALDWEEMTSEGYEAEDIITYLRRAYPIAE